MQKFRNSEDLVYNKHCLVFFPVLNGESVKGCEGRCEVGSALFW